VTDLPLVVVADDNADIRLLVDKRLSKRGYRVVTAANGEEALGKIRELRPDAVVLDWMMPVIQGPDVVARLRAEVETKDIPIVMLTARAAEADVAAGFECGADDYLTKPFDVTELDQVIKRLLAGRG
jgi:two-component system, OmpR family, phosphate regulon response regulator PhoB